MSEMPYGGTGTAEAAAAPDAGDSPGYGEAGLGGEYDGDARALAAEDQLPARQDSRAAAWGDSPEYDEADLGAGYDGDLDALTAEDQTLDATAGDQDEATGEAPPAAGRPGDLAAEVAGASAAAAPDQEDGNVTALEASPAGAPAGTDSPAEADAGIPPGESAQPADNRADPEAELKELKAEYEASLKDLKTELQALKDLWGPAPEAPEGTRREADQPSAGDRKRTTARSDATEAKPEGDRPGLWSNAKTALYGAIGTTVTLAAADQFMPGAPHPVVDIATGAVTVIAALVPTLREGWKRKHDNPPD
jgi:hypothetical protein